MFKIHISNLRDGEHEYEFNINKNDFVKFELNEIGFKEDIKVKTHLYKSGNQFDLKTTLEGRFDLQCDRCIEPFIMKFSKSFEVVFKYDFAIEREALDNDEDEIKFIKPKTGFIDLSEDIRDYIVLSIPMKKAPEEKDDKCIYCGKTIAELLIIRESETINPVWEKLIKQKNKKNKLT